jgi:hypothetical protein
MVARSRTGPYKATLNMSAADRNGTPHKTIVAIMRQNRRPWVEIPRFTNKAGVLALWLQQDQEIRVNGLVDDSGDEGDGEGDEDEDEEEEEEVDGGGEGAEETEGEADEGGDGEEEAASEMDDVQGEEVDHGESDSDDSLESLSSSDDSLGEDESSDSDDDENSAIKHQEYYTSNPRTMKQMKKDLAAWNFPLNPRYTTRRQVRFIWFAASMHAKAGGGASGGSGGGDGGSGGPAASGDTGGDDGSGGYGGDENIGEEDAGPDIIPTASPSSPQSRTDDYKGKGKGKRHASQTLSQGSPQKRSKAKDIKEVLTKPSDDTSASLDDYGAEAVANT